jgi:uncharacterized protein
LRDLRQIKERTAGMGQGWTSWEMLRRRERSLVTEAETIIAKLALSRHPEGGWYRETWAGPLLDGRASASAILFLLQAGDRSHWHRVDADELWVFNAGAALSLSMGRERATSHTLGPDLLAGQMPQIVVPKGQWQAASSMGAYSLVTCIVSPGFRWGGFELASPGFDLPG